MSGQYLSADIESCSAQGHRLQTAWSDKTPLKVSLICKTCTGRNPGKTVYVAYGTDVGSFGPWRERSRSVETEITGGVLDVSND